MKQNLELLLNQTNLKGSLLHQENSVEDEEEEIIEEEEGVLRIKEASSANIVKGMDNMNLNVERKNLI